jgi:hypothetical protein
MQAQFQPQTAMNPMQVNPYQAGIQNQNLMLNPNDSNMMNWNSQYGGY